MNIKKLFSIGIISFGLSQSVFSQEADVAVGQYLPPEKDAVIEIYKCGNKYCGKTICIKDNFYKEKEKDKGVPGTPYLDHNNEDPKLRTRPNLGMTFMKDFEYVGEGVYKNGTIYSPREGKTYCGKFTSLEDGKRLDLRGNICYTFFHSTNNWVRATGVDLSDSRWDCVNKPKK